MRDYIRKALEVAHEQGGPDAFLKFVNRQSYRQSRPRFAKAQAYSVVWRGAEYPSKAALSYAYHLRYLETGEEPEAHKPGWDYTRNGVANFLYENGARITGQGTPPNEILPEVYGRSQPSTRNPNWVRDELILALDMYMQDPQSPPGKSSPEVLTLSKELNQLNAILGRTGGKNFRNPNGVYMKVMNFRRFDPLFASLGKSGLSHGGAEEEDVWNEFASDPARLAVTATKIKSALAQNADFVLGEEFDDVEEAQEGRLLAFLHYRRERSRKLVNARIRKALADSGELRCEACDMSFSEQYGERGDRFMEVHHTRPLHTLDEGRATPLTELALVCSNCHRMIHRRRQWLTIAEMISIIAQAKHKE
ncbi:hypothetical protein HB777_01460 [Mesorhizobium loti]|nr:hypothetical protein HB777_01460 [Mesorhizobium loti]